MVNITIDKKTSRVYYYIINLQEGIFRDMTQTNCMNKSSFANAGNPGFYPCAHITYIIEDALTNASFSVISLIIALIIPRKGGFVRKVKVL